MAEAKQYLFVSNRNIVIGSIQGYSLGFEKGVPMHVPRSMHSEVMEKGILPCDSNGNILDEPEVAVAPESKIVLAPEDDGDRADAIAAAIDALAKRNNSTDFSAGGVPTVGSVSAVLGWKADSREIRKAWDKYKVSLVGK